MGDLAAPGATVRDLLSGLSVLRESWPGYAGSAATHVVEVAGVRIGGPTPVIIAGPCAVESAEHALAVARAVRAAGAQLLRGGVFKPRTSPHSFQGLGAEGLAILREARRETGLGIVTEVMDPRLVELVAETADMLQIGSRSMQNFPLLTEVGRTSKPILLKRGFSATFEEWLGAAEYIAVQGNKDIVLCERGVRASAHHDYARNILDLNALEPLRELTPLPVIVDPSHATGDHRRVPTMSRAALAAGAHGLIVEVVHDAAFRDKLRSDGAQAVLPETLAQIVGWAAGR